MNTPAPIRWTLPAGCILVVAIGFLVRLYVCRVTVIIPPDGALYLYQAKMVMGGQWDKTIGCGLGFLSSLPLLIAGAYSLVQDWVIAAQAVSLAFGTATLVCIYLTLRQFCDRETSSLATLIPALTPEMVSRSADVVREPVFWFFLSLGLYLFVRHAHRERAALYLAGSQLAFLMAAWARIEGVLVLPVSLAALAWTGGAHRWRRLSAFLLPLVLLVACLTALSVATGNDLSVHFRAREVLTKATAVFDQYGLLRDQLETVADPAMPEPLTWYLPEARSNIWLVAAGVLINRIGEGFFYPFLILYLVGVGPLRRRLATDDRLIQPVLLTVAALILFYFYTLETWMLHYRMVIVALIPGTVSVAFGVAAVRERLGRRFRLAPRTVVAGLGLAILLVGLPKNLLPRDPDKAVFREIGRRIAAEQSGPSAATVMTTVPLFRWVSFYANLEVADPPCPQQSRRTTWSESDGDLGRLLRRMKRSGVGYWLWDERHWSGEPLDPDSADVQRHLQLMGQWTHPDTGRLMLFKVKADPLAR